MFGPALTLVLALASSSVIAVPMIDNVYKRAVASLDSSSTEFPFHFPESVYESIPQSGDAPSSSSETDNVKAATDFISKRLNLDADDFKVVNSYTDDAGISHVYGAHMVNGAPIANHQAAAHAKNGQVTCFSSSFGTDQHLAKRDLAVSEPKATMSFEEASSIVSAKLEIPVYSEFKHTLEYVAQSDGKVVYSYKFQLRNDLVTKWIEVWCNANTGEVVQAINFAKKATYKVVKIPHRDPTEGFSTVSNPEFKRSSPDGWTDGKATEGNNVITLAPGGKSTPSIRNGVFKTKFNSKQPAGSAANVAATAVNLFYVTNVVHDIAYQYGFTEIAGNFQKSNFDKGGEDNDAVTIKVFDTSDYDNAEFIAPPDGQPGEMLMYRFTDTTLNRTPGFDNTVVVHEYAHGISNRLTGGAAIGGCFTTFEAGGVDEGWGDVMAMMVLAKESDTATTGMPIGAYISDSAVGFRSHLYTTDMTVNPLTYGNLKFAGGAYAVGVVWASMLWQVYWNLVEKHGFSTNLYDAKQSAGNVVAMKIFIGGLTLQPCNPGLLGARNAIIDADKLHYNGTHKCEIFKGFAKRGLGSKITSGYTDDFSIPDECQ
ncbi:hypothetical protein BASA50_006632 [Batrachochytrium salamandrivorans]|uniref:Extracellular metalloproteinase n=1 Tax=Batrachochytrium salamandrivorans TaxID=1357716 RepID=A0ABQ8F9N1_9FUNG|nr:hypothetical protein BASA50_006632 [Batrachochytrium salamandrivorans]